jgi:hypothetical protein
MKAADNWQTSLQMSGRLDFVHLDAPAVECSRLRDANTKNMTFRLQRAFAKGAWA